MKKNGLLKFFFIILPKAYFSRIFGSFTRTSMSSKLFLDWYIKKFKVNMQEAEVPEKGFSNLDEFFTRRMKDGVHKIDNLKNSVISPVDARIDQFGDIIGTRIIQAKDMDFILVDLLPSSIHHLFIEGKFITLYLSPSDYHRIHSPVSGNIFGMLHVPGKLYPVMELMVNGINRLFSKNERLVTYIQTKYGKCVVCKIGAMNVGRISVSYDGLVTNSKFFRKRKEILYPAEIQPQVRKGDELGMFHLGSTVILIFEKDMIEFDRIGVGQKVRMGQRIGFLKSKKE